MSSTYVLYTNTLHMGEVSYQIAHYILRGNEEIYSPIIERNKRIRGKDVLVQSYMFPGYLFITTDDSLGLYVRIRSEYGKAVFQYCQMLRNDDYIYPLKEAETEQINALCDAKHIVRSSEGYMIGDKLVIQKGPLKDLEGRILRIDRHKKIAAISCDFMNDQRVIVVGLEVAEKSDGLSGRVEDSEK